MGSFEFGVYVYVWTWVLLLGGLVDLGIATGGAALHSRIHRHEAVRDAARLPLRLALAGARDGDRMGGCSRRSACGCSAHASALLRGHAALLACVGLPLFTLGRLQDGMARSYDWINLALMPPYVIRSLLLIGAMARGLWLKLPTDASTAMLAAVATTWVTVIGQTLVMNRRLRKKVEPGPKAYQPRAWLAASVPIFMVEGFYLLLTYADVLLLRQYRPPEEVAVYYAAAKTLALVAFVSFLGVGRDRAQVFRISRRRQQGASSPRSSPNSIKWTFWPSLAATVVILALGKPFLWLFGPQFVDGYFLMFILAIGPLARATVGPVERLLNMVGEQRACALVYAVGVRRQYRAVRRAHPAVRRRRRGGRDLGRDDPGGRAAVLRSRKQRLGLHVFIWRPKAAQRHDPARVAPIALARERADAVAAPRRGRPRTNGSRSRRLPNSRDEWRDLARRALEPNVFYDPAFALAAAPVFGADAGAVLVWSKTCRRG